MFYFGICVTFTILAFNLKIVNTFLYLQNHSLVRDCRNYFRPREHPRRRTHNHQLPYYARDYGWRLHIWSERTVSHLVWSRGELFICRKREAFRRGTESSDKSLPVPTDYRGGVLQTPKSLHSKGVLNILNLKEDYCFLWCILAHIHRVKKHADELYNYKKFFNELDVAGLHFPLKFSNTPKFENLNPSISFNELIFEYNEVFSLYASKHRDRKHHVNLLMISNNEGKFHYLLVRDWSALVVVALNTMATRTCALTATTASRRRVCSQLTCLIVPSIPSRR